MKTIVCFGDSNTYGYNPHTGFRYDYEVRWPGVLQKMVKEDARVIEEGLNGRTTCFDDVIRPGRIGLEYLDPCLHSHGPVDLVILMLGTNDLKVRFGLTPITIGKAVECLIKKILEITPQKREDGKPADILLVSPIHIGDNVAQIPAGEEMGFERALEYSKRLAPIYEEYAKAYGIDFLDAAKYAKPSQVDACHMEPESHGSLGRAIGEKVKEILERVEK
ncbi:MAG: SGNH/GDSL hydrolase family protein [Anaerostipes sp.]|nr:SGNH/GDSL hydrolase family protein [Anaerostipes sp.]